MLIKLKLKKLDCSEKLFGKSCSVSLHPAAHHSAPLHSEHGYAWVHCSIYIYTYWFICIWCESIWIVIFRDMCSGMMQICFVVLCWFCWSVLWYYADVSCGAMLDDLLRGVMVICLSVLLYYADMCCGIMQSSLPARESIWNLFVFSPCSLPAGGLLLRNCVCVISGSIIS